MLEWKKYPQFEPISAPSNHAIELVQQILRSNPAPTVCEIGVGIGATSLELCRVLAGNGQIFFFDYEDTLQSLATDLEKHGFYNFKTFGCRRKRFQSYNWPLAKLLLKMRQEGQKGIIDFAYLDGAHTFHHDAPAALMLKDLLKPEGVILFDDYDWSLADSPSLKPTVNPTFRKWFKFVIDTIHTKRNYDNEQLMMPHVKLICDLFFDRDPAFIKIDIGYGSHQHRRAYRKLNL